MNNQINSSPYSFLIQEALQNDLPDTTTGTEPAEIWAVFNASEVLLDDQPGFDPFFTDDLAGLRSSLQGALNLVRRTLLFNSPGGQLVYREQNSGAHLFGVVPKGEQDASDWLVVRTETLL